MCLRTVNQTYIKINIVCMQRNHQSILRTQFYLMYLRPPSEIFSVLKNIYRSR